VERENKNINQSVILNLIQDLRRLLWLLRNSVCGRFQIKSGMTSLWNRTAFTLIELLVVVLIIGILAAIALPQYQKAVKRARIAEYEVNLKALAEAEHAYYLEHGEYANMDHMSELDITIPECKLLPGLGKFSVGSCKYIVYGSVGDYERAPVVELYHTANFPMGAIFLLPIQDQISDGSVTFKAGTLYCAPYDYVKFDCTEFGFTNPATQVNNKTYYTKP
jgi:prepilin-type N-terminal cleavage/methylation domain-containing protein